MVYIKKCGLLGEKLGHSYSPEIHSMLSELELAKLLKNYSYELFECDKNNLEKFLLTKDFYGLNITVPYKKLVFNYCSELSEIAKKLGSVNIIIRRDKNNFYGDNTDYFGFEYMLNKSGVDVANKKVLVLGSGGASVSVKAVLENAKANVIIISRSGKDNYNNILKHSDARIIINTTPVGMYPDNGNSLLDLNIFLNLEAVFDIIYNPMRTDLMLKAESLGIKNFGGLDMLVAQAKRSAELFTESIINNSVIEKIIKKLAASMQNIILIGMPGCGKSAVAEFLNKKTGRAILDSNKIIKNKTGYDILDIFANKGELFFRDIESLVLKDLGKKSAQIICTDDGCVEHDENYFFLHQNGLIFWLKRKYDLELIKNKYFGLNKLNDLQTKDLEKFLASREALYYKFADFIIDNNNSLEQTTRQILDILEGKS